MTEKKKARIRTIRDAIALIKQADDNTAVTYHFIRKLCDGGQITSVRAGKKILINYDEFLAFLGISRLHRNAKSKKKGYGNKLRQRKNT